MQSLLREIKSYAMDAIADTITFGHDLPVLLIGQQIRAARALLRWSHGRLAKEAKVGIATIQRAEAVDGIPNVQARTLNAIQVTLERAGVVFLDEGEMRPGGPGVRLHRP